MTPRHGEVHGAEAPGADPRSPATAAYPTRREHDQRWITLARAIAAERDHRSDDPSRLQPPPVPGELVVIGSGIETVGFTVADETYLRRADHVFYCVADPATVVWLKSLRPDAYDLYVLYGEYKQRYVTYMEMSEAMLHFVRKGDTVAAVYYGHPGVFVLSTHRAIKIARREGHRAVMRAAVSALDTLCADLGIDPSQPGLQTFEATDMLIRRRRPDAGAHLVLWQVGLIGELGYRRHGFLNHGFVLLVDYLESFYGADHPVINYVGSRYPGIEPVIDHHTVGNLRSPDVQATVTGISTFYIPPKDVSPVDPALLAALGLIRPGQEVRTPASPLRVIDHYGAREMKAFDDLATFRVPDTYHWQEDTAAARFVLALRDDVDLQARYAAHPAETVAAWPDPALAQTERTLLAKRDAGAMQIAAKGLRVDADASIERMLTELLTRKSVARDLLRAVRRADPGDRDQALAKWSVDRGFTIDWEQVPAELDRFMRRFLFPWTGLYLQRDAERSILVLAGRRDGTGNRVIVDGTRITRVRYAAGVIRWRAADGNPTSGQLQTDMSSGGRRLIGSIWGAGEPLGSAHRIAAAAHPLSEPTTNRADAAALAGTYLVRFLGPQGTTLIPVTLDEHVTIGDTTASATERTGSTWTWSGGPSSSHQGHVTAVVDPISGHPMLFGSAESTEYPAALSLSGMVPIAADETAALTTTPRLGIPPWAWTHVIEGVAAASHRGGMFLWHSWDASVMCVRMVRGAIREANSVAEPG